MHSRKKINERLYKLLVDLENNLKDNVNTINSISLIADNILYIDLTNKNSKGFFIPAPETRRKKKINILDNII